jgi:hypothetical protein
LSGCLGGCLGRVLALLLLAIVVVSAWRFGPEMMERLPELRPGEDVVASPELADRALDRYERLVTGEVGEVRLSAAEVESVLRYHLAGEFPAGVGEPSLEIRDGELRVRVPIALELLPAIPELEGVRGVLPDTVPVEFRGVVVTLDGGRPAFIVRRIDAAGVPIPRRFHGAVASAVDPFRGPGIPEEAVELPLPPGAGALRVEGDVLVVSGPR